MGVLVQVLRGGGVSESLYLLVVSLFLWLFWGGGHPHRRGGGSVIGARRGVCHRCAAGCCFVGAEGCCFIGAAGVLLRRRGGVLLRRRGGAVAGGGMKKPLSVSERRVVF